LIQRFKNFKALKNNCS